MRGKVLVVYVFHIYNDRVKAFIKGSVFYDENVDFIIVSNDEGSKVEIPGDKRTNVEIMYRKNIGYDFGGWSDGVLTNERYKSYDRFIFVNSSVAGPFLPAGYSGRWTDIYLDGLEGNVKLFGSTINTMGDPVKSSHVQSYIFSMDRETLEYLIRTGIFSTSDYAKDFDEAIEKKEVLMSRKVIERGWNIGSLLPLYRGVDFTFSSKKPEDYGIEFLDDVMYERYRNKLWRDEELVFIKGNRINVQKGGEEGFSDYGGGFGSLLFILVLIAIVVSSITRLSISFKSIYGGVQRLCRLLYKRYTPLLVLLSIVSAGFFYHMYFQEGFQGGLQGGNKSIGDGFELVVSRYMEDIQWLEELPKGFFSRIRVYNKGKPLKDVIGGVEIIELENIGRESHTYLTHVVNNYSSLAKITVFVPGSVMTKDYKAKQFNRILDKLREKDESIIIGPLKTREEIEGERGFTLNEHKTSNDDNRRENPDMRLNKSNSGTLGAWYDQYFPGEEMKCISWYAIFAASADDIHKRPVDFYRGILATVSSPNPEEGHYLERLWSNVFSIGTCEMHHTSSEYFYKY
jgi:hypothetical protein